MLDILKDYLQGTASHELTVALEDAHRTFDELGMDTYEAAFEELLVTSDERDASATLPLIVAQTQSLQRSVLAQHDVVLAEDLPVSTLTLFIRALLDVQDYSNRQDVAQIVLSQGSPEELFADLVALVTGQAADNLLPVIESVGQFLITRLKEFAYAQTETVVEAEDLELQRPHLAALKRFCDYIGTTELYLVELLSHGLPVGYPFDVYRNPNWDQLPLGHLAKELVATALVSHEGLHNPKGTIANHIELILSNVDQVTQLDIEVNKLLVGLSRHEQA